MRQWIYLTYNLAMSVTTLEDIIVKHIKTLNLKWFNKKLKEFESSPLYDREKQILFYKQVRFLEETIEELDKKGLVVNITIQNDQEIENIIDINFREFCRSSNYYKDDGTYYPFYLAEIESLVKGSKIEIYQFGLEEVSENLINDLNIFKEDITPGNIYDFIASVVQSIKLEFDANLEGSEEIYKTLREDLCKLCTEQLSFQYANKLSLNKIHGAYRDKLNIGLNIEDFSALLLLMLNANILDLDRTTYDFCENI